MNQTVIRAGLAFCLIGFIISLIGLVLSFLAPDSWIKALLPSESLYEASVGNRTYNACVTDIEVQSDGSAIVTFYVIWVDSLPILCVNVSHTQTVPAAAFTASFTQLATPQFHPCWSLGYLTSCWGAAVSIVPNLPVDERYSYYYSLVAVTAPISAVSTIVFGISALFLACHVKKVHHVESKSVQFK